METKLEKLKARTLAHVQGIYDDLRPPQTERGQLELDRKISRLENELEKLYRRKRAFGWMEDYKRECGFTYHLWQEVNSHKNRMEIADNYYEMRDEIRFVHEWTKYNPIELMIRAAVQHIEELADKTPRLLSFIIEVNETFRKQSRHEKPYGNINFGVEKFNALLQLLSPNTTARLNIDMVAVGSAFELIIQEADEEGVLVQAYGEIMRELHEEIIAAFRVVSKARNVNFRTNKILKKIKTLSHVSISEFLNLIGAGDIPNMSFHERLYQIGIDIY